MEIKLSEEQFASIGKAVVKLLEDADVKVASNAYICIENIEELMNWYKERKNGKD